MSKVYLCGITSSEFDNLKALTDSCHEVFDGMIWVCDDKTDQATLDLLEERKGCGEILRRKWTKDHDLSMNVFLRESVLKQGDWFVLRDSMERFNPEWVVNLPKLLDSLAMQRVQSIFNYGKGFAFQWHDGLVFFGSPHWGLHGIRPLSIDFKDTFSEEEHQHTWRIRDGEEGGRPVDNKIDHEAKYLWCYGRTNHLYLGVDPDDPIAPALIERADTIRQVMRHWGNHIEGCGTDSVEGLKNFMLYLRKEDGEQLGHFVNSHRVWKNFFRYHILEEDFHKIEASENVWEYKPVVLAK